MKQWTFSLFLLAILCAIVCNGYPLPQKRRIDYPEDQDCHLCHAVVIEVTKRIGSVITVQNIHNVVQNICKTADFRGYSLYPDEIRVLCPQFVKDHRSSIELAILRKYMNAFKEGADDVMCKELNMCSGEWSRNQEVSSSVTDMEEEL